VTDEKFYREDAEAQRNQAVKTKLTKAVGSTRLRRVQFGVPPNCRRERTIDIDRTNNGKLRSQKVSGAPPARALAELRLCVKN
jgi:hypothetical protein